MLDDFLKSLEEIYQNKIMLIILIIGSWIIPLTVSLIFGLRSIGGLAQAIFVYSVLGVLTMAVIGSLQDRKFRMAEKDEIKREDDILLQATAFSQSALWIYLNILPSNLFVNLMKWVVPSVAISFYIMRAFGKLKDNAKLRYWSIFPLVATITSSVAVLIWSLTWDNVWSYLLIIDGFDLRYLVYIYLGLGTILGIYLTQTSFKTRYGLAIDPEDYFKRMARLAKVQPS